MGSVLLQTAFKQVQQQGLPKHGTQTATAFQISLADVPWLAT